MGSRLTVEIVHRAADAARIQILSLTHLHGTNQRTAQVFSTPNVFLFFSSSSFDSTLDTPVSVEDFEQENDNGQVSGEPGGPDLSGDFERGR